LINWTNCNIDGAKKGNPNIATCGGNFRNHDAEILYCFAEPLGNASSYQVELTAPIYIYDWHNIWLETDSALVVLAFNYTNIVVS
jgi:ribonuclease HI